MTLLKLFYSMNFSWCPLNKAFVGLGSCDNVQTERKIFEYASWPRLQIKRTGPSSLCVQLVCPAGIFSWSVQLVRSAGPPSWSDQQTHLHIPSYEMHLAHCLLHIASYTLHLTHYILHNVHCTLPLTYCILNIASYTLHLAHCILHIVSYTLHLTYCILQFASQALNLTVHKSLKSLFQKSLINLFEISIKH